jgi:glucose/mannose transport system permease protein
MTSVNTTRSSRPSQNRGDWFQDALPRLVLSPSLVIVLVFVYGFILFTMYLSFTDSRLLPSFGWVGWQNYDRLFQIREWDTAVVNLLVFGALYITICCVLGLFLAILLDQKDPRRRCVAPDLPLSDGAVVSSSPATAWKWIMDPGIGIAERSMRSVGLGPAFTFNWIKDRDMAIYTVVIAAVWQTSRLRDGDVPCRLCAASTTRVTQGCTNRWGVERGSLYRRIVIPLLASGVSCQLLSFSRIIADQILRPDHRTDGGRSRAQRPRTARDLHVFLHLHPQFRWASGLRRPRSC